MELSILVTSPSLKIPHRTRSRNRFLYRRPSISCRFPQSKPSDDEKRKENLHGILKLSTTLTVIASSLHLSPAYAAKVSEKKQRPAKKIEYLSPEEIRSWNENIPVVSDRIPYTEILNLKEQGKLKHIIKLPTMNLKQQPDPVLVVLDDSRVLRTVLPSIKRDEKFWKSWDRLELNSVCVNAYTPPIRKPELPSPYLGFLFRIPQFLFSFVKPFVKPRPKSKKALELERTLRELQRTRKAEMERMREEREMMEKASRAQKKIEEKKRNKEMRKLKHEQSLIEARKNYQDMALMWANMARDQNVSTALGFVFFFIFYRTVVFNYRKQKKDYDDRIKIEKAEAEERKKMRELEKEMAGIEEDDDDGSEGKGDENDPFRQVTKFMGSGARLRRARSKRLPQYLERGIDVKFSDVAGLGNIRIELEEIVKFFTHGDMYRRRGVKIPGWNLLMNPILLYFHVLCKYHNPCFHCKVEIAKSKMKIFIVSLSFINYFSLSFINY